MVLKLEFFGLLFTFLNVTSKKRKLTFLGFQKKHKTYSGTMARLSFQPVAGCEQ